MGRKVLPSTRQGHNIGSVSRGVDDNDNGRRRPGLVSARLDEGPCGWCTSGPTFDSSDGDPRGRKMVILCMGMHTRSTQVAPPASIFNILARAWGLLLPKPVNIPLIVLAAATVMLLLERARPGRRLPRAPGFLARAIALNSIQAASVFLLGSTLDDWWSRLALWDLGGLGTAASAAIGYLAITFIYYWWHRARHEIDWLWRALHQVHHSPARLEVVTSFYKHPLEIGLNAFLSSAVLYGLVGVSPEAGAVAVLITGLAELVYHWNVRTPRWMGWLFQRPEMHCVHHERSRHAHNYSDLPLWDILFGTFNNPEVFDAECGFEAHREARLGAMLLGVDVNDVCAPRPSGVASAVVGLGLVRMAADPLGLTTLGGVAAATGASPAPKVFTAFGTFEPFSTQVTLRWTDPQGNSHAVPLHPDGPRLRGAYNRRNAYGAVVVFLPEARRQPLLRPMFEAVAQQSLCRERPLLVELGINPASVASDMTLEYRARPGTPDIPPQTVQCLEGRGHA
ncbi:MAG: sterol desaturase family protein [Nannocystaceae bacterium]|nr:sterol desaturase family protein [Nannocystaceae bacterium]